MMRCNWLACSYDFSQSSTVNTVDMMTITQLKKLPVLSCLVLSSSFLIGCNAGANKTADVFTQSAERHLEHITKADLFSGTIRVQTCDDSLIYTRSIGFADHERSLLNTPETKYRVASITKQFTAAIILKLVEDGRVGLADPISKYLPDYPNKSAAKVTIHQLMSNTSGIPNLFEVEGAQQAIPFIETTQDILDTFWDEPLSFEPGTEYTYSNSNYVLLGAVIESVTGLSYAEVLHNFITDSLEMNSTGYYDDRISISGLALTYDRGLGEYVPTQHFNPRIVFAAGNAYTSTRDLHKFNCALHSGKLISESLLEQMIQSQFTDSDYGYGQNIETLSLANRPILKTGHGGDLPGIGTQNWFLPEENLSIIVLGNSGGNYSRQRVRELAHIYFDEPMPPFQKELLWDLAKTIKTDGIEAGIEFYEREKKDGSSQYEFLESDLNRLGYYYLEEERVREAIEVLELAAKHFPNSANAFDSLAEAHLLAGNAKEALANYQIAMQLGADNPKLRKRIDRLMSDTED